MGDIRGETMRFSAALTMPIISFARTDAERLGPRSPHFVRPYHTPQGYGLDLKHPWTKYNDIRV
jgi:hypothetical protein